MGHSQRWFLLPWYMTHALSMCCGTWPLFLHHNSVSVGQQSDSTNPGAFTSSMTFKKWLRTYFVLIIWMMFTVGSHLCYVVRYWIGNTKRSSLSKYDLIVRKLLIAENWTFNVTAVINLIVTYFTSRNIPIILKHLDTNEKQLQLFFVSASTHHLEKSHKNLDFIIPLAWFSSIYAIIIFTMILEYSGILYIRRDASFFNVVLQDMGKLSMMTFDFQFSNFCTKLQNLFFKVNIILHHLKQKIDNSQIRVNTNKLLLKQYYSNYQQGVIKIKEISYLDTYHRNLCDIIVKIQQTYQIQISLNLAVCFFNTVCVLFITLSEYRAKTNWLLWISGLLWVTYYVLRVIMVCTSATQVIDEACKSKKYLSCIEDQYVNTKVAYHIQKFLLRITHTDIRFTLCNLLTVNTSLLSSAGLGVITYLVIALQYSYT